tara:strand:+ start:709 stop:948 length:240 start_codon:yes stop_codon:yes gene_type:complete
MTRKDYMVFTNAIKSESKVPPSKIMYPSHFMDANGNKLLETFDGVAEKTLRSVADRLLVVLKRDDPRFDVERFVKDCGF